MQSSNKQFSDDIFVNVNNNSSTGIPSRLKRGNLKCTRKQFVEEDAIFQKCIISKILQNKRKTRVQELVI